MNKHDFGNLLTIEYTDGWPGGCFSLLPPAALCLSLQEAGPGPTALSGPWLLLILAKGRQQQEKGIG